MTKNPQFFGHSLRATTFARALGVIAALILSRQLCLAAHATQLSNQPPVLDWMSHQWSISDESAESVDVDNEGNVFAVGFTRGNLGGTPAVLADVFLNKYDPSGSLLWTHQLDSGAFEKSHAVSVDSQGSVYISGYTYGGFEGPMGSRTEAFLMKYNNDGMLMWSRQQDIDRQTLAMDVSTDQFGNILVSGLATDNINAYPTKGDAFVSKYEEDGDLVWTRLIASDEFEESTGVAADSLGNVYVTGYTYGDLGGPYWGASDVFLNKYDADGDLLWSIQPGSSSFEMVDDVAVDGLGGVYITGDASARDGDTLLDYTDAFVSRFDADGNLIWTRELSPLARDFSGGIVTDALGNVYATGFTGRIWKGDVERPVEAIVSKLDRSGNLIWTAQVGSASGTWSDGIAIDGRGGIYIAGSDVGYLEDSQVGGRIDTDIFVAKFSESVPEPSCLQCLMPLLIAFALQRRRAAVRH